MTEKVIVYSQPNCGHCDRVKNQLMNLGVAYEEINVREDAEALDKLKNQWGYSVTPVVEFEDGFTIANPDEVELKGALYED